jgi:hypothetical protein
MRWTEKEINETIDLLKEGKDYNEISSITGRPKNAIRVKMGKLGETYKKYNPIKIKYCLNCESEITNSGNKFCSHSCSATHNNKLRSSEKKCLNCGTNLKDKRTNCCSHKCDKEYKKKSIFKKIVNGDTTLNHRQYKKYLIHVNGEKCMECGWCEVNPYTNKVPIELEHIDGNSNNNKLDNLKLLCPNCHSLTPTYRALNIGKGRHKRRERYKNGQSY